MTSRMQKRLAIGGAVVVVALLLAYKGFMLAVAFSSQTACVANAPVTGAPARHVC